MDPDKATRVLQLFNGDLTLSLKGSEIIKQLGMLSGAVFPILMSLERNGWLDSHWESLGPGDADRPRERRYRLTELGYSKSGSVNTSTHVTVTYIDYKGNQMTRRVLPIRLTFGKNQWQSTGEYMIVALDLDTNEIRSIPIKTIQEWRPVHGSSKQDWPSPSG